jgi:hypothetical protein
MVMFTFINDIIVNLTLFCLGGFYGVVKKMTFLKKSVYLANNIIVNAMSAIVFVMDH